MPFFENLSESLSDIIGLAPRQRPDDRHHHQRSSNQPARRPQSPPPLPSHHRWFSKGPKSAEHSPVPVKASPSKVIPSDVDEFPPLAGSSTARGRLRPPTSPFTLEPSARLGNQSQMLSKEQQRNEARDRHEEARPFGGGNYRDHNAVNIAPAATVYGKNRKVPGSSAAFKPWDRISNRIRDNTRDSGPVRAQGKAKNVDSYPRRNPPDISEYEESSRPNKRRRHRASNQTIDLVNADATGLTSVMDVSPPANEMSPRLSPSTSQYSATTKNKAHASTYVEEYRGVHNIVKVERSPHPRRRRRVSSSVSQDERFIQMATQQRRSFESTDFNHDSRLDRHRERSPDCVVVQDLGEFARDSRGEMDGTRRGSIYRESSDELQGETTTQPVPKFFDAKHQHTECQSDEAPSPPPARRRSPADIRPTNFTTGCQALKKPRKDNKRSNRCRLQAASLRFGSIKESAADGESLAVYLDLDAERIELSQETVGPLKDMSILFWQISAALIGNTPSRKVRLRLLKIASAPGNQVDLEFSNLKDKERLCQALRESEVKIQDKDESFMDRAFANLERDLAIHSNHDKRPVLDDFTIEPPTPSVPPSTRPKLSASPQDDSGESRHNMPLSKSDTKEPSESAEGGGGSRPADDETHLSNKEACAEVEIPVKKFLPTEPPARSTRSMARSRLQSFTGLEDEDSHADKNQQSPSTADAWQKKWRKPLVYPRAGKRKAEVSGEDRDRLREDEFLNDNLIGFYIRFLQDHLERTNHAAAQRVYFFNSYFFDTLTNMPRSERAINYSGVEKWTRNVDLFSYDYIVVPINENAHWYVAIICNLPSLSLGASMGLEKASPSSKEPSNQPESIQDILETPEPEPTPATPTKGPESGFNEAQETAKEQQTRHSLASMTLFEDGHLQDESEGKEEPEKWPEAEENPAPPPTKFKEKAQHTEPPEQSATTSQSARKSKKKMRMGPKLDPLQTTIITFDSLDLARSPTIKVLREYICKEAASKRGVEIDNSSIKGMRARQIPLQPNYSDCGLYLLAYVEKFVQDPDQFITKLLRRDMDAKDDWPPLGSGLLRHRLRNFLDDLYDEQARVGRDSEQRIMADRQPVSYLLGPPPSQDEKRGEPQPTRSPSPESAKKPVLEDINETGAETDAEDSTSELELLPTGKASRMEGVSAPAETTPPADVSHPRSPTEDGERDVIQVPDSQETPTMQASPKHGRSDTSSLVEEAGVAKKRKTERNEVADVDIVIPVDPTASRNRRRRIEVQIPSTPPAVEPGHKVRRSSRGVGRRD